MNTIQDDGDRGYDPSPELGVTYGRIDEIAPPLPSTYLIPRRMLPPVGTQGTPASPGAPGTCAAWASTYGLATSAAARAGGYNPSTTDLQASPALIYVQVKGSGAPPCSGTTFEPYFQILAQSGTPSMAAAPYYASCDQLIGAYQNSKNPPRNDPRFRLAVSPTVVHASDADSIRQALLQNRPLAYGTKLYTDWSSYVEPLSERPYVGNGVLIRKKSDPTKFAGHCMMIIGYDDTMAYTRGGQSLQGAYLIQNSEGTDWGEFGYVWMAYETFLDLAQGSCYAY
jgi:Papain family cysteine protease